MAVFMGMMLRWAAPMDVEETPREPLVGIWSGVSSPRGMGPSPKPEMLGLLEAVELAL